MTRDEIIKLHILNHYGKAQKLLNLINTDSKFDTLDNRIQIVISLEDALALESLMEENRQLKKIQ